MSDRIIANCKFCGKEFRMRSSAAGRKARCSNCGEVFHVPKVSNSLDDTVMRWLLEDQARETRKRESGVYMAAGGHVAIPAFD